MTGLASQRAPNPTPQTPKDLEKHAANAEAGNDLAHTHAEIPPYGEPDAQHDKEYAMRMVADYEAKEQMFFMEWEEYLVKILVSHLSVVILYLASFYWPRRQLS